MKTYIMYTYYYMGFYVVKLHDLEFCLFKNKACNNISRIMYLSRYYISYFIFIKNCILNE